MVSYLPPFRRGTSLRRRALVISLCVLLSFERAGAQVTSDFDPVGFAKLRAGEIARAIRDSPRQAATREVDQADLFVIGLLLQAGLRALLPVSEREGVALPGEPGTADPEDLVRAQRNAQIVLRSGREAMPAERAIALAAVRKAAEDMSARGYRVLSEEIFRWLEGQKEQ